MATTGGSAGTKGNSARRAALKSTPSSGSKASLNSIQQDSKSSTGRISAGHTGARLRARRESSGVSLRQFARDLGVSASFLSQLETGKAQPSVATLYSICAALNMSIDELFAVESTLSENPDDVSARGLARSDAEAHIHDADIGDGSSRMWNFPSSSGISHLSPLVTPSERKALVLDSGVTWERLTAMTEAKIDFVFVRYDVGGSSNSDGHLTRHAGTEYGFVIRGVLEVNLGFETYRMNPGDAISYDSSTPHRLTNVGDVPVEAIWFGDGRNNGTH